MQIFPAIDVQGGKVVRLRQGRFDDVTTYSNDVLTLCKRYADAGARRIHVVDLDAARTGELSTLIALLAQHCAVPLQLGGGMRSKEAMQMALSAGIDRVVCGTVAVEQPDAFAAWARALGPTHVVLALDVADDRVVVRGWEQSSALSLHAALTRLEASGVRDVLVTDVKKDGMMQGPSFSLYERLVQEFPAHRFIASGGAAGPEDIVALRATGVHACVVGKAFLEGKLPLEVLCTPG